MSAVYQALHPLARCLTIRAALERCPPDVTESALRGAIRSGALPRVDVGTADVRIHPGDLAWWVAQRIARTTRKP